MKERLYFARCCQTWQKATDLCCSRLWLKDAGVGNGSVKNEPTENKDRSSKSGKN